MENFNYARGGYGRPGIMPTNPPRPSTGQFEGGGSCKVTMTFDGKTSTCHGTMSKKGVCKPCNKMAGVGRTQSDSPKGYYSFVGGQKRLLPTSTGGRGQKLWFNQSGEGVSVSQYLMGLAGVGILFFVIGYGYKTGVTKA